MKMLLPASFLAILMQISNASAQSPDLDEFLSDLTAKYFAYFRSQPQPMLPIFIAAGEQPGDTVRDLFGGRFSHVEECFDNLDTSGPDPSAFTDAIGVDKSQLAGTLGGQFTEALSAAGQVELELGNRAQIVFDDVVAVTASDVGLRKAFSAEVVCPEVHRIVKGERDPEGVLILGTVFYARPALVVRRAASAAGDVDVSGSAADVLGEWQGLLDAAGLGLAISGAGDLRASSSEIRDVRLSSLTALPVAYRPAFISLRHLDTMIERITVAEAQAFESNLLFASVGEISDEEAVGRMAPTFAAAGLPPSWNGLFLEMSFGEMVAFDLNNPTHLEYMRRVALFSAAMAQIPLLTAQ